MSTHRLANERSPYLLQHADNPVDWYPWCDEAFEKAQREDKPVFLSIGYSACHWCHVMAHESFEDDETARVLNRDFVSIKVDREERPDIDSIYQIAHQLLTQRAGGWPLSVFLRPDKKPFFAGTYFPNARRHGMPSFRELLAALHDAWTSRRGDVDAQAGELTRVLGMVTGTSESQHGAIDRDIVRDAARAAMRRAEPNFGGFGHAPKFPNTMLLDLLFVDAAENDHHAAREHVLVTLDRMARGGIYDQLGGGFARYSTDERWLIPHFEKMLYDNALLTRAYVDAWRVLGDAPTSDVLTRAHCERVVRESVAYVLREMTDANGVFYSAQDADSEGVEGKFFAWTPAQIAEVVGADDRDAVCKYFAVNADGNFEHGTTVLSTPESIDAVAHAMGRTPDAVRAAVERGRAKLFAAREKRIRPMRDDKSLASWNALMIGALADAGATFGEAAWVDAAKRSLFAWRDRAFGEKGLRHAMKAGEAYGHAFLDDDAGLARAAIDVYEACFDPAALAFARTLVDQMLDRFWNDADATMYFTPSDAEVVLHRTQDMHDNAYPGGAGLAADALLRLGSLTGVLRYRTVAEKLLARGARTARENPMGFGSVVRALDRAARGAVEIVVAGEGASADALVRAARETYVPHRVLLRVANEAEGRAHGLDPALVANRGPKDGAAQAFVCRGTVCNAPVQTAAALVAQLRTAVRAG